MAFPGEKIYLGQSVDVVRRFAEHRRDYDDIIGFAFRPTPRAWLAKMEKDLIYRAEKEGLVIRNTVHASNVVGHTRLDLVLPPDEQTAWASSPESFNRLDVVDPIGLSAGQVERFAGKFEKLRRHPLFEPVLGLLRSYVAGCVPAPSHTEFSFWAVSCCPGTNAYTWPRLACVNVGWMEAFVLGYFKDDPSELQGKLNVASDVLFDGFGSERAFKEAFPWIRMRKGNYRDAGQHQVTLHADDETWCRALLENGVVRRAAAELMLRVMRKGATVNGQFHCKQLADAILPA